MTSDNVSRLGEADSNAGRAQTEPPHTIGTQGAEGVVQLPPTDHASSPSSEGAGGSAPSLAGPSRLPDHPSLPAYLQGYEDGIQFAMEQFRHVLNQKEQK